MAFPAPSRASTCTPTRLLSAPAPPAPMPRGFLSRSSALPPAPRARALLSPVDPGPRSPAAARVSSPPPPPHLVHALLGPPTRTAAPDSPQQHIPVHVRARR